MSNKLRIQLSQSSPQSAPPERVEPLEGVALDAEQTATLFDGMEPLPAQITQEFQIKPATLPPALVGATVATPFEPAQVATQAAPSDTKLSVQLTSPQGEAGLVHQVMIVFSRPVVSLGDDLDAKGVTMSPSAPGKWRWVDTMSLLFEPDDGALPGSTDYDVSIPTLTTFDGHTLDKASAFKFSTSPVKLVAGFPVRQVSPGSQPKIVLRFDQPVDAAKVFEGLKASIPIEPLGPSQTPDDVDTKDWRDGTWVVVQPARGLPADAEIKLTLKKGTACGLGQRTTTEDQSHTFRTAGVFKVRSTDGSGESPTTWWTIHFTNDVDPNSYKKSEIVFDPPFAANVSNYGDTLSVYGLRDSRTTYRVTLPESMCDVHGQPLQGERTFTFKTTAGWPSLEGPNQHLVTLPVGSNAAFQLRSMEYARLSVSVYVVDPSDYPDFWSKYYDCLYNEGTPPGVLHSTQILDIESPEKWTESKVDLPAAIPHMIVIAEPKVSPFAAIKERVTGSRRPRTLHWVQRTQLAATTRFDQGTGHVLVTKISDAHPQADVEIWGDGIKVATTNVHGHAQWPLSAQHMLLRRGDDSCLIDGHLVPNYHHAQNQRFHVFSDRGLYKPGESARIKGWTRTVDLDGGLHFPAATTMQIIARDPHYQEVWRGVASVDDAGEFDFELPIGPDTTPGLLMIELAQSHTFTVQVQEFRRPEFEVSTQVDDRSFTQSEPFVVTATSAYYTGEPLAYTDVLWHVRAEDAEGFQPPGWPGFEFGRSRWRPWFFRSVVKGEELASEVLSANSDADGKHALEITVLDIPADASVKVTAQALVHDVQRQAFAGSSTVWVHPSDVFVGVRVQKGYAAKSEPFEVDVVVVDAAGNPVTGHDVVLRLEHPDADGEPKTVTRAQIVSNMSHTRATLMAPHGGSFSLVASAHDTQGRAAQTSRAVWSAGEMPAAKSVASQPLEIVSEVETLTAGSLATFLIVPPFARGSGIAVFEWAGRIRHTETFEFVGTHTLSLSVTPQMAPGMSLKVALAGTQDGVPLVASGSNEIAVDLRCWTLNATIKPDQPSLSPGESTKVKVAVTRPDGSPVSKARLTFWAVDESVLALADYTTPDPLKLYQRIHGYVREQETRLTIPLVESDVPDLDRGAHNAMDDEGMVLESASFAMAPAMAQAPPAPGAAPAKRSARSRGGGGLPPEPPAGKPVYIRRDFSALAAFETSVLTDDEGVAHVDVKVPDSLTRYRLMANVAAESAYFGSGDAALVVRQPLMVRPTKPRFLNVGDRAEFPVVVQNATAKPTQVWLGLRASNLAVTQGGWRVELGANERREVRFPVAAKLAGQVSFQIVGRSDENTDAAEDKFNVMTPATSQTVGTSGTLEDGAVRQDIATPPDAYAAFGGLEVRLSTTLLAGLTDLVVDVFHYPYACAEQRASRLMSIALLKEFLPAFKGDDVPSPAEMLEAAAGDLVALKSLQKSNGGWGFWHEGRAYPTVTIHVVHALVEAKLAGMPVDEAMLAPGLAYLDSIERHVLLLNYSAATRRHLKLHAAWVRSRAGHDETARAKAIWKKDEGQLTVDALGWLLSIFAKASASEAAAVYQELANRITYDGGKMQFVDEPKEVEKHVVLSSNRRSNAIVLDALIDYPARQIDVSRIATALLAHRWKGNSTTQENAFALLGLIRYFREFEKTTPDLNAVVYANDFQVSDHVFQGRQTDIVSQTIPMEWLQGQDPVSVVVSHAGAGRLYWRANMRWAPQDLRLDAEDRGFHVERTFAGVDAESDVTFNDGVWRIKAGAKVRLTTTFVARKPRHHVALVSPIPAGLELLNPAFATTEALDEESSGGVGGDIWAVNGRGGPFFFFDFWWRRWFDHQVLRDDRAEAFSASVWPGVHEHVVFARATMPGEYVVPPARAEEMYEPEVWGRTSSLRVVVE